MNTFKTPKGTVLPILNLRGKDYLQVAHRLVWFCEERPDWSLSTEIISVDTISCVVKATIKDQEGKTRSTAHKKEHVEHFEDYIEKAETGAIGRALAMVGFGTQFTGDELDEGKRLADSPLPRATAKSKDLIHPQQPPTNGEDGNTDPDVLGYKIPFGKFKQRSLEEVGPRDLSGYINYLERTAKKDGKTINGVVADFILRATEYIVHFENENEPARE